MKKVLNMDDSQIIQILTEIKEQIKANNTYLATVCATLQADRAMMWKILGLTIIGAFAIIGVKIAFP